LGDATEKTFRQSLIASGGNPLTFVGSPISAGLLVVGVLMLFYPLLLNWVTRRRTAPQTSPSL
jgi:TctA family transporter